MPLTEHGQRFIQQLHVKSLFLKVERKHKCSVWRHPGMNHAAARWIEPRLIK
jgi:hypothetical protein